MDVDYADWRILERPGLMEEARARLSSRRRGPAVERIFRSERVGAMRKDAVGLPLAPWLGYAFVRAFAKTKSPFLSGFRSYSRVYIGPWILPWKFPNLGND